MINNIHSIAYYTDDKIQIRPLFKLRYECIRTSSGMGQCLVDIVLKNNGAIGASYPFICLTEFGLNVAPASGWVHRDIRQVRKMKRFTFIGNDTFEPGAEIHCCTIILKCDFNKVRYIEFERGNKHSLEALPYLNLVCVIGAGNYPSARMLLQVPAAELKGIIDKHSEQCTDRKLAHA